MKDWISMEISFYGRDKDVYQDGKWQKTQPQCGIDICKEEWEKRIRACAKEYLSETWIRDR